MTRLIYILFFFSISNILSAQDNWRYTFSSVKAHLDSVMVSKDISEETDIIIPTPDFAYVNLIGITDIPTSRVSVRQGWIEVYDGNGNYFTKRVILKAQGSYTQRFPKKNFSCEFCNDDWSGNSDCDIYIGDWVGLNTFHFKGFYTDCMKGLGEVAYKVFESMIADRDPFWIRGGYEKKSKARCYPDGFPCAVYLNGEFNGVYAWQLTKNRKNMNMKKTAVNEHIHIDGDIRDINIFRGEISWTSFEVRNPQNLYSYLNIEYDGLEPSELMGSDSKYYNVSSDPEDVKESKIRTAKVKAYIERLSKYHSELETMQKNKVGKDVLRSEFEKRYDVQSLLDYYVFNRLSMNYDGRVKNWQWFTYDGVKWFVAPYDLDQTFGKALMGFNRPATFEHGTLDNGPYYWINKYYTDDERQRYYELRDNGIINHQKITGMFLDWQKQIGPEYYSMEQEKWPESPCYLPPLCNDNWEPYDNWDNYFNTLEYDRYITYKPGDVCLSEGRLWICTATSTGIKPVVRNTDIDSLDRASIWLDARIKFLDDFYGYYPGITSIDVIDTDNSNRRTVLGIYNLSGARVPESERGIKIIKYSDGTVRKEFDR